MKLLFVLAVLAFSLVGCGGGTEDHSLDAKLLAQQAGSANFAPRPHFLAASGGATNLLTNANFESGDTGWTASYAVLSTNSTVAHSGSKYVWLGGYDNAEDTVYQEVAIPASAQQAYIQFWYQIQTSEASTSTVYDTMTLDVFNAGSDTRLATLKTYSNSDKTTGWAQSAQFDLSTYRGRSVRLKFTALTDASNETSFLIDDVTVAFTAFADSDTVYFSGNRANYTITRTSTGYTVRDNVGSDGTQTFTNAKVFKFADMEVALGADGTAAKVFRLYQAAFDRQPDSAGLGFQISASDRSGLTLLQLSENFINSAEFLSKYGNLNNTDFVKQLYQNVLHRAPDTAGLNFHVNNLDSSKISKSELLLGFSESAENQTQVQGLIENGITYTPYVAPTTTTTTTSTRATTTTTSTRATTTTTRSTTTTTAQRICSSEWLMFNCPSPTTTTTRTTTTTTRSTTTTTTSDGSVNYGGLNWSRITGTKYTWPRANDYCTSMGRRLPTLDEIRNLYLSGQARNSGWALSDTWTKSTYGEGAYYAYDLSVGGYGIGYFNAAYFENNYYNVVCVR